jgi:hypothetical protein
MNSSFEFIYKTHTDCVLCDDNVDGLGNSPAMLQSGLKKVAPGNQTRVMSLRGSVHTDPSTSTKQCHPVPELVPLQYKGK